MTRRQLMRHTAWFGAAVVLTVTGGEVSSQIARADEQPAALAKDPNALRFLQISDSHLGFKGTANTAVEQSFADAIQQINEYRKAFGQGTVGDGWYSFDLRGVHFISLVNTLSLESLGHLGQDQIEFVRQDVAKLSSDTPIVVFSHIPLFALYPKWGWGTDDATQALSYLKRFSSVTCLNGHIHQLFTKTEGNITFHSATTTAYPLPRPGERPAPSPVTLPAGKLKAALGIREVQYVEGTERLAIKDVELA
ncbi:metallophosphoesterase [Kribbella sp. NPDC051718]|uniref:metallophosphoesterase family protein n=1 Tax=Kribbella sp. NPDC051718 TaxID=3155168 RepID=UPI0034128514